MIDAITSTVSAVDVAERLGLEPSRSGYICCPWHNENTPSLKLYPSDRGWHCFGCGKSGDVIDMVAHVEGLAFRDACQWLSDQWGLGLTGKPDRRQMLRTRMRQRKRAEQRLQADKLRAEHMTLCERQDEIRRMRLVTEDDITDEVAAKLHDLTRIGIRLEEVTDELASMGLRRYDSG